jgi:hypothetical protein
MIMDVAHHRLFKEALCTGRQLGLDLFAIRVSFVSTKLKFVVTKSVLSHKNIRQTFTFSKVKFCNDENKFCSTKLFLIGQNLFLS